MEENAYDYMYELKKVLKQRKRNRSGAPRGQVRCQNYNPLRCLHPIYPRLKRGTLVLYYVSTEPKSLKNSTIKHNPPA